MPVSTPESKMAASLLKAARDRPARNLPLPDSRAPAMMMTGIPSTNRKALRMPCICFSSILGFSILAWVIGWYQLGQLAAREDEVEERVDACQLVVRVLRSVFRF